MSNPRKPRDPKTGRLLPGYTDAEKKAAIDLAVSEGLPAARRATGIPKGTIHEWVVKAGLQLPRQPDQLAEANATRVQLFTERRLALQADLLDKAQEALDRMDDPYVEFKGNSASEVTYVRPPAGAVKDLAVTCAVLLDKLRLELGESTGRTESWVNDHVDHERGIAEAIRQELAERARQRTAQDAQPAELGDDRPPGADRPAG